MADVPLYLRRCARRVIVNLDRLERAKPRRVRVSRPAPANLRLPAERVFVARPSATGKVRLPERVPGQMELRLSTSSHGAAL